VIISYLGVSFFVGTNFFFALQLSVSELLSLFGILKHQ